MRADHYRPERRPGQPRLPVHIGPVVSVANSGLAAVQASGRIALAPRAARTIGFGDTAAVDAVKIARATITACINARAMDAPQSGDGNSQRQKDGERPRSYEFTFASVFVGAEA